MRFQGRETALLESLGWRIILFGLLAVGPWLPAFYRTVLTEILIWGLYALSFSLVYGQGGMASFGQALFFGTGAYGLAYAFARLTPNFLLALAFAVVAATLAALLVGLVATRLGSHHFIMITMLTSTLVMLVLASDQWRWLTGQFVGKRIKQSVVELGAWSFPVTNRLFTYYLILLVVTAAVAVVRRVISSPAGQALAAIKSNPERAALVGYNTQVCRLLAFAGGGALAGLAGALYAFSAQYNFLDFFSWELSARAVVWSIVGGTSSVAGAFLGAAFVNTAVDLVSSYTSIHQVLVGLILVAVVRSGAPGLLGMLRRLLESVISRSGVPMK